MVRMWPRELNWRSPDWHWRAVIGERFAQEAQFQKGPQLQPSHDPAAHGPPTDASTRPTLPPALPASAMPTQPRSAATPSVPATAPGLADFERIAMQRNPTLRQAAAQVDATMNRSFQAGLYPNPTVGYVQEQIGTLGEVTPTASGIATRGRGTPGELVGGFVQQEIVTGGKLRLSRAKFAEEANAARWQSEAQILRVINGVRVRFFDVLAAQRLIQIHGELARLNDDAVRTTDGLVNVGQANEPDLLQAKVEARRARVALRNAENHYCGNWEHLVSMVGAPELRPTPLDDKPLDMTGSPLDFEATWQTCCTAARRSRRPCPRFAVARSWSGVNGSNRFQTSPSRPSSAAIMSSTTSRPQAFR